MWLMSRLTGFSYKKMDERFTGTIIIISSNDEVTVLTRCL